MNDGDGDDDNRYHGDGDAVDNDHDDNVLSQYHLQLTWFLYQYQDVSLPIQIHLMRDLLPQIFLQFLGCEQRILFYQCPCEQN